MKNIIAYLILFTLLIPVAAFAGPVQARSDKMEDFAYIPAQTKGSVLSEPSIGDY